MSLLVIAIGSLIGPAATKLDLKLGDRWTYQVEQSLIPLDAEDPKEEEQRFTYRFGVNVTGVKRDEYDLEVRSKLMKHRFGGEDLPNSADGSDLVEVWRMKPGGFRVFEPDRYSDAAEYRLSRLSWFGFPGAGKPDNAWNVRWPGFDSQFAPPAQSSYQRAGATTRLGRSCTLYRVEFRELGTSHPMQASGKAEVDEKTGILMYLELRGTNAPMPGGNERQRLEWKVEATELKLRPRS